MEAEHILTCLNQVKQQQIKFQEEINEIREELKVLEDLKVLLERKRKDDQFYEDVKKQVFLYIITTILGGIGLLVFYGLKDAVIK